MGQNKELLFACLNDRYYQYRVVESFVFDLICSKTELSLHEIFTMYPKAPQKMARLLYVDIMVNYLGYSQRDVAKVRFDGNDQLVHSILSKLQILNNDYEKLFDEITAVIAEVKDRNHLVENPVEALAEN